MQPENCAAVILGLFEACQDGFKRIARRSRERFEKREWHEFQRDAVERLDLYRTVVDAGVAGVRRSMGEGLSDRSIFPQVKRAYADLIAARGDTELAETFFN